MMVVVEMTTVDAPPARSFCDLPRLRRELRADRPPAAARPRHSHCRGTSPPVRRCPHFRAVQQRSDGLAVRLLLATRC